MALHESKKIGTSDITYFQYVVFDKLIDADGLYQIVYGGLSSASDGSNMEIYVYKNNDTSVDPVLLDSLFCPKYSTNADFAIKASKFYLNRNDYIFSIFNNASDEFAVIELIG